MSEEKPIPDCLNPNKYRLSLKQSRGRPAKIKIIDLLKPEYKRKTVCYFNTRTERLRFTLNIFDRTIKITTSESKVIRRFLNQNKFTRAEIHTVLFNLGFRYKYTSSSTNHDLVNLQVDGYIVPKTGRGKLKYPLIHQNNS
jgi:hypothetical protein